MALSLNPDLKMSEFQPEIVLIMRQFLCGVPLKLFQFKVDELRFKDTDWQKNILNLTVLNPLVKKFPVLPSYRKAFLKFFMKTLEDNGIEICEELYVEYTNVLRENEEQNQSKFGHKIYFIDDDISNCVILRENEAIVSQGSTGLITWQAAKFLADFCIHNKELFCKKRVLELGCGLGLTGFYIAKVCRPRSYFYSDYHSEVLGQLFYNLQLNRQHKEEDISNSVASTRFVGTDFLIGNIDWSNESSWNLSGSFIADVILAADVVYDVELTSHFINCLSHFLHGKNIVISQNHSQAKVTEHRNAVAYVACTVRNEETIQKFLTETETQGLLCNEVTHQTGNLFFYDPLYQVKLYKITPLA